MNTYWRYAGGITALLLILGTMLPSKVIVERDVEIAAFPATVFALLNDFKQVNRWSRWQEFDPNARIEITGPPRGIGAKMQWNGQIIGSGHRLITHSTAFANVTHEFVEDNTSMAEAHYSIARSDAKTHLIWRYEREFGFNLVGRYFGLMLDGIIGPDGESDLKSLKEFAERLPRSDFSALDVEPIVVEASDIAYRTTTSIPAAKAISDAIGDAYFDVLTFIDRHDLEESGAPLSITRTFSGSELVFDAAIPVNGLQKETPRDDGVVKIGRTYAGPVIRSRHTGSYRTLGRTHDKIAAWLAAMGIERNGDAWEVYISDPTRTIESELLTYVYYPVK